MKNEQAPTFGHGKICYLLIPAEDPKRSSEFYRHVFGWNVRERANGQLAFDDGVGEVSGTWISGKKPETDPNVVMYIMVKSAADTLKNILSNGGKIVEPVGPDTREITALFSDPAGNVFGIYQERQLTKQ